MKLNKEQQALRDLFLREKDKCRTDYLNHFFLFENNEPIAYKNQPCYASHKAMAIKESLIYTNKHHNYNKERLKQFKKWISFVLRRSPLRSAFIEKPNVKQRLENGFLLNTERSNSYLVAAGTFLRWGWEANKLPLWIKLTKLGFSEREAYCLAYFLSEKDAKTFYLQGGMGGHGTFENTISTSNIKIFCKEDHLPIKDTTKAKDMARNYFVFNTFSVAIEAKENSFYGKLKNLSIKENPGGWGEVQVIKNNPENIQKLKEILRA